MFKNLIIYRTAPLLVPELAEAVNQRVACHLGAFTEHLKRNRKPAALA